MWIVRLPVTTHHHACYGPFEAEADAQRFAAFLGEEVDPAFVEPLYSPLDEVLNWRESVNKKRADHVRAAQGHVEEREVSDFDDGVAAFDRMIADHLDFPGQARAWRKNLDQAAEWTPADGRTLPISRMEAAWRHNAARWLLRHAGILQMYYSHGKGLEMSDPIGREVIGSDKTGSPVLGDPVVPEMPHEVDVALGHEQVERAHNPAAWLKTTPLYQALVADLPENVAELAKHWSSCGLRTGQGAACSCEERAQ